MLRVGRAPGAEVLHDCAEDGESWHPARIQRVRSIGYNLKMADLTTLQHISIMTGMVTGAGGLALGIANTLHSRRISHPRLRVTFEVSTIVATGDRPRIQPVVTVSNIGHLPVHGGMISGRIRSQGEPESWVIPIPLPLDRGDWPRSIEPGHKVLIGLSLESLSQRPDPGSIRSLEFVSTVGRRYRASRKSVKRLQAAVSDLRTTRKP